mmetsp:Transcript_83439/g.150526  ORF Transcript_83439/g.150526 Transcript_83439/m.150526 type:complete len:1021 (-) Transcript_83439:152-3214(-)
MLATGIASAFGYAATAYSYNLGRFQYDSTQRQNSMHQTQNMRIALWSLFREDVRELFELTKANMETYMVVGTLIVASAINFIVVGYKDFPMDPPFLVLFWNNSVFCCITFGLVSVWLAMHGSISSNSARVKILTQAVRPPVPSVVEVQKASRSLSHYEGLGSKAFLQPPQFLGWAPEKDVTPGHQPEAPGHAFSERPEAHGQGGRYGRQMSHDGPMPPTGMDGGMVARLGDEDGGPGLSANLYSHFWMLRRVQRGYACFDAYARICLAVSAQQLLLIEAYFALGHFMSKTEGWPSPTHNSFAAWLALAAAVFASITLFKLDLFVDRRDMFIVQGGLSLGPILAGLATHLSAMRTEHGMGGKRPCDQFIPALLPWALAILACFFHAVWIFVLLWAARPESRSAGLPLSFRSAIYLDVFGWHNQHFSEHQSTLAEESGAPDSEWGQPGQGAHGAAADPSVSASSIALRQARRLARTIAELKDPRLATHLSAAEKESLQQLQEVIDLEVTQLQEQLVPWSRQSSAAGNCWLQCQCEGDSGHVTPYWVNSRTADVSWNHPGAAQIIDLPLLGISVNALHSRVSTSASREQRGNGEVEAPVRGGLPRQTGAVRFRLPEAPAISRFDRASASESLPFELMPESPNSTVSSSQLPWHTFQQTCRAWVCLWLITMLAITCDPKYYDSPHAPREIYDRKALVQLQTVWPHAYFRPSALSCSGAGKTLILGDQFSIYTADLPPAGELQNQSSSAWPSSQEIEFEPAISTMDLGSTTWRSFGLLYGKGQDSFSSATALLLLSTDGTVVVERDLGSHSHNKLIQWTISPMLDHVLQAIQPVEGAEADKCASKASGFVNLGWAIYAATDAGQVVVLCPALNHMLQPLHVVLALRRRKSAPSFMSVVDSHTGTVKVVREKIIGMHVDVSASVLWLFVSSTTGKAEIRAWDLSGKGVLGRWPLPSGRRWAHGLCDLGPGGGLLLATASTELNAAAGPELWRLVPDPGWSSQVQTGMMSPALTGMMTGIRGGEDGF